MFMSISKKVFLRIQDNFSFILEPQTLSANNNNNLCSMTQGSSVKKLRKLNNTIEFTCPFSF